MQQHRSVIICPYWWGWCKFGLFIKSNYANLNDAWHKKLVVKFDINNYRDETNSSTECWALLWVCVVLLSAQQLVCLHTQTFTWLSWLPATGGSPLCCGRMCCWVDVCETSHYCYLTKTLSLRINIPIFSQPLNSLTLNKDSCCCHVLWYRSSVVHMCLDCIELYVSSNLSRHVCCWHTSTLLPSELSFKHNRWRVWYNKPWEPWCFSHLYSTCAVKH